MSDEVLPVGRRPRCRGCGKELRPNYDTQVTGKKTVKEYRCKELSSYYGGPMIERDLREDDENTKQDKKGRWFRERQVPVKERTFLGTYGAYKDSMFCGLTCAYRWAVGVCEYLEKQGKGMVTYDQKKART